MTECQGCGAWNERHRTLCVLCGTPLAETDEWDAAAELPPLPPLPDGGLSVTMPAWLRAAPGAPEPGEPQAKVYLPPDGASLPTAPVSAVSSAEIADALGVADSLEPAPLDLTLTDQPLGPQADPRTFLRDDDFPRWIRELPTLPPRRVPPVSVVVSRAAELAPLVASSANLDPPATQMPAVQITSPQGLHTETKAAPPAVTDATVRRREPWETPLLVVLVVGVVVAVIWALLVNGLIGSGL